MRVSARFLPVTCLLVCLLSTAAGCGFRTYEPKPLDPTRTATELTSRSLEAPGLRDYLRQRGIAVDPWPRSDWTLTELTWVALYHTPELDIARSQLAVARAGEVTAAQRPNPAIQLGGQHHSQTTAEKSSPWTVSLILDLPIVTGGKREAQIARAEALSEGALLDLAAVAWQVRNRVQARYIDCHARDGRGTPRAHRSRPPAGGAVPPGAAARARFRLRHRDRSRSHPPCRIAPA